MKSLKFIPLLFLLFVCACVEQMIMIPENPDIVTDRVVLLEELTGVDCPNCPKGAAAAKEILATFPGKVVVVAIHGDFLAEPITGSQYDFRFEGAAELENYLKPWDGKPAGSVNRTQVEGEVEFSVSKVDLWSSYVQDELEKPHVMDMTAEITYDPNTRGIGITTAGITKTSLEGDYNITVMLTENHIIDAQKDVSVIVEDYEHEHVLRAFLTPFDGTSFGSNLGANQTVNNSFTYTLPDEDGTWVADNIEVVAFVHRVDAGHKEVIQAYSAHLVE